MRFPAILRRSLAANFDGPPFKLFGPSHRAALLMLALALAGVWLLRGAPEAARLAFRWAAAAALVINELSLHAWRAYHRQWTLQTMLPLHLCSLMVWGSALMLVAPNPALYEFLYFMGIGAASQALLTPDLDQHNFPHVRYFIVFISHGLIVATAVYMTVVEGFRPQPESLLRVALWMHGLMLAVGLVNWRLGSNYMFLARPPDTPSLIDTLGPWPWYLLGVEAIGLAVCLLLYLPFAVGDWLAR